MFTSAAMLIAQDAQKSATQVNPYHYEEVLLVKLPSGMLNLNKLQIKISKSGAIKSFQNQLV